MKTEDVIRNIEKSRKEFKQAFLNCWYVFFRDLKRLFTNPCSILTILFIFLLPSAYAWCTICANWDPYGDLTGIKIAVVNNDIPANSSIYGQLELGNMIEDNLKESNDTLGWVFAEEDEAWKLLDKGDVYAALIIPESFSNDISRIFSDEQIYDQVKIRFVVNERENGASNKITQTGSSMLENKINNKFITSISQTLSERLFSSVDNYTQYIKNSTLSMSDKVHRLADGISNVQTSMNSNKTSINDVKTNFTNTKNLVSEIKTNVESSSRETENLKKNIEAAQAQIPALIAQLQQYGAAMEQIVAVLQGLESTLSSYTETISELNFLLGILQTTCGQLEWALDQAIVSLDDVNTFTQTSNDSIVNSCNSIHSLANKIDEGLSQTPQLIKVLIDLKPSDFGSFIGQQINLNKEILNEVNSYGTSISPFFSNLSFWIAGLILIALYRTEVDDPKRKKWNAKQAYVSRAMMFSFIAIVQGIVCCLGNLVIGVAPENPIMYVVTGAFSTFVYVNIIYMLGSCFKHIGKAIAVVLVIMQIPGTSGMFPVKMMPHFYQTISPFLPFTYSIHAMRETISSMNWLFWATDVIVLMIFVLVAGWIGVYARGALANLNTVFDIRLAETGLMECDAKDHIYTTIQIIENIRTNSKNDPAFKAKLIKSLEQYRIKFEYQKRKALILMAVVPILFLSVCSVVLSTVEVDINVKVILMMIWILSLIALGAYVVSLEFKHSAVKEEYRYAMQDEKEPK